ncbi:hypothetical protein Hanom_Chr01g00071581 [Helianthus anomalus]
MQLFLNEYPHATKFNQFYNTELPHRNLSRLPFGMYSRTRSRLDPSLDHPRRQRRFR